MFTRDLVQGVHRLEHACVNTYLVEDGDGLAIIDAGLPAMWPHLCRAVAELGHGPGSVKALLLTHAHFDHVGTADRIRREFDTPVWVHDADRHLAAHPYRYQHEKNRFLYPLRHPAGLPHLAAMTRAGALTVRGVTDVHRLAADCSDSFPGRPEILHTPGHTAGHVALYFRERDVLICGDALVTLDPYTGARGPQIVAGAATADSPQALASLTRLAETGATHVLTGHGEPWTGGIEAAVEQALERGAS